MFSLRYFVKKAFWTQSEKWQTIKLSLTLQDGMKKEYSQRRTCRKSIRQWKIMFRR